MKVSTSYTSYNNTSRSYNKKELLASCSRNHRCWIRRLAEEGTQF